MLFEYVASVGIGCFLGLILIFFSSTRYCENTDEQQTVDLMNCDNYTVRQINNETTTQEIETSIGLVENEPIDNVTEIQYYDSINYLAQCVEAEAGNQCELGKRLVCDVILNRFDAGDYISFYEIINEQGQFECVENNYINECTVSDETYKIVNEEIKNRTNNDVMHFRTENYHTFGTPLFQVQDHYFSK